MSWSTLRPLSGRSTICSWLTTVPTLTLVVSTMGETPATRTVSLKAPTDSVTLTDRVSPTWSTMPVCSNVLKPLSFAESL
jgi:hypothetical protein